MNAGEARMLLAWMTGLIERESAATRKVIAAIPNDRRDYKHDERSRSAWDIATHLALSDIWFADAIVNGAFVWTGEPPLPAEMTDPQAVARWHETHLDEGLARLRGMSDEHMLREIDFFGTKAPAVMWLGIMNNHAIHHRGQLATYLRPMGSKVPAIYGMSADESAMVG